MLAYFFSFSVSRLLFIFLLIDALHLAFFFSFYHKHSILFSRFMRAKRQLNRNNIQKNNNNNNENSSFFSSVSPLFLSLVSTRLQPHSFNSWLNVYLLKRLLYVHVVGLSFCVGFHITSKKMLCVDIARHQRTHIIYKLQQQIGDSHRMHKNEKRNAGLRTMNDERWWELNKVKIERKWRICELNVNARENPFKINGDCVKRARWKNHRSDGNNCELQVQIDFYCTTFQLHFELILSEMKREPQIQAHTYFYLPNVQTHTTGS